MPENQLDAIRRFIKEGEARLKKAAAENPQDKIPYSDKEAQTEAAPAPPAPNQNIRAKAGPPPEKRRITTVSPPPAETGEQPPVKEAPSGAVAASPGAHVTAQQVLFLQKRLKIVLESSRDAIISVDANRKWTPANRRLLEWLGYGEEEFRKINFDGLFQPEFAATLMESFARWLEGEAPLRRVPGNLRGKENIQIPVLISSHAGLSELAEPFAYLMLEDVRPQRNLDAQMERGRALANTILQEGSIPTFVIRRDGVIEQANRTACERLEISPDEISGMRLRDFAHAASLKEYDDAFGCALRAQFPAEAPCTFFRDNLVRFRGRIRFAGVADAHGAVERIIGMLDQVIAEPSSAWIAYGQMTPGILSELSGYLASHIRFVLEQVRTNTKPDMKRLVKGVNSARSVISRWMESAALIPEFPAPVAFGNLILKAIDLRKTEFSKWGITAQFENTPAAAEVSNWPREIFQALLHVIQWCIENLREDPGNRRLVIWAQKANDGLEVSFICRCAEIADPANPAETETDSDESQGFKSLELRLARKLVDSVGATLVLENMSKVHKVLRICLRPDAWERAGRSKED